ncbi:diamine N-acetyltransferase [Thermoflexales bacterium]|nr:diamine N-acetyltransferase [Thermoflexales bacterium]
MIRLIPMTETEYQAYLDISIREYAEDKVKAGNWQPEEALERSAQEFQRLLPEGVATRDQYLYNIEEAALGIKVGMIWLARIMQGAHAIMFIYDFRIDEPYRRKGYGEQAMRAAEDQAKTLGLDTIALHVFGYNHAARALYEKLGYETTNINMAKKLAA